MRGVTARKTRGGLRYEASCMETLSAVCHLVVWLETVEKGQFVVCSDLRAAECAGELKEIVWSRCTFSCGVA